MAHHITPLDIGQPVIATLGANKVEGTIVDVRSDGPLGVSLRVALDGYDASVVRGFEHELGAHLDLSTFAGWHFMVGRPPAPVSHSAHRGAGLGVELVPSH